MPWFKVDDTLTFHAKVVAAGNAAMGLWVRAGAWSAQQLTEGHVPAHVAATIGKPGEIKRLVAVGLWTETPGGYQFWQWDKDGRQPTREQVEANRAAARERQRLARERAKSRRDMGVTNAVTNGVVTVPPTRPDPTVKNVELQQGGERPVTLRSADATKPPQSDTCTRHPNGNPTDEPCRGCQRVEERTSRRAAREADRARVEAERAAIDCDRCDGTWIVDADKNPTRRKCDHRRSA